MSRKAEKIDGRRAVIINLDTQEVEAEIVREMGEHEYVVWINEVDETEAPTLEEAIEKALVVLDNRDEAAWVASVND